MASSAAPAPPPSRPARRVRAANFGDRVFHGVCTAAAGSIFVLTALLVIVLFWHSWLAIRTTGLGFFTHATWDPEPDHRVFGALAFIFGTVITSGIAMAVAVPLGIGTAAYLAEIAPPWFRPIASFFVEMLAAIPSVVYGFWGLYVLAPEVQRVARALGYAENTGGLGILSASLVLSIMIVPYVTAVSYDVCRAVPSSQRQAALALGATRWQMIRTAVLPYARPGIVAACFLALGRALGETMAVTMLIGNKPEITANPLALGDSIASVIANQFTEATYELYLSALVELGLVLFVVTIAVNALGRLLLWRIGQVRRGPSLLERLWERIKPRPDASVASEVMDQPERSLGPEAPPAPVQRGIVDAAKRVPLPSAPEMPPEAPAWANKNRDAVRTDRLMTGVLLGCVAGTVGPLFFILGYLVYRGAESLDWAFFTELPKPVGEPGGGIANALYGSAMLVGLATFFAVPIGLLAAIYLAEYRNGRLAHAVRFIAELLGGVPSIVIGIFAYNLLVVTTSRLSSVKFSGWAGGFALGVMMLPIVVRASEEALKLVPRALRNASMALGACHWQTTVKIAVPAALPAIITAIFLAIARVAGETAPLLLTAGDNRYWPNSPSDQVPSVPFFIFKYAASPFPDWHRKAWAAALVLMIVVLLLNFGIRWVTGKRVVLAARAD